MNTETVNLSVHVREEIDRWKARFPEGRQRSAVIAALHAVQHEQGHLTPESMEAVAKYLELPSIQVFEIAAFYSMFETRPVGQYSVSVCTNISCMLCGGDEILEHVKTKFGVEPGQSTADGRFFLKEEFECLAACTGAPMMMVDHVYYENLTPDRVDEILDGLD